METQKEGKVIHEEGLIPEEQKEQLLVFYRKLMQSKRETQAEIRKQADNPEFWKAIEPLLKRNAERGTPFI